MSYSKDFAVLLVDILHPLGPVQVRRMFSGAGVFLDGLMFGLIVGEELYLKADAASAAAFEAEGCSQFAPRTGRRHVALPYWRIPERLLDDPDELVVWARQALDVALKQARSKRQRDIARPSPKRGERAK